MKPEYYIIHYAEIAIKGKNRPLFERTLIQNIAYALKGLHITKVKRQYGRILVEVNEKSKIEQIETQLLKVPGIKSIAPAWKTSHDLELIKKRSLECVKDHQAQSWYVKVKRSYKAFPLKSPDLSKELSKHIRENTEKVIDFIEPEATLFLEVVESGTYIYTEKKEGIAGLPVNVSGKVLVLISGGIDSPVAAFQTLKRGCKNLYIHFHSEPYTKTSSKEKVIELTKTIADYQQETNIHLVPFIDIQKAIMTKTDKKYRVVLYRRFMLKIAEKIARKVKAKALVTGENLGQVASQTLENIHSIQEAVKIPIIQPLITFDKQEIIDLAKKIGSYELSIQPHDDCCSLFVPKHPIIKSELHKVLEEEQKLEVDTLIDETLKKIEKVRIDRHETERKI